MVDLERDGQLGGRLVADADFQANRGADKPTFVTAAQNQPPVPVQVLTAAEAYQRVVAEVGASRVRDSVDRRIIAQLTSLGTSGAIIHDESSVGGAGTIA